MIVILAGVTMNALLAWLAFTGLTFHNGEQIDPVTTVGRVTTDSLPAGAEALAALRPGDRIVAVNGDRWRRGMTSTTDQQRARAIQWSSALADGDRWCSDPPRRADRSGAGGAGAGAVPRPRGDLVEAGPAGGRGRARRRATRCWRSTATPITQWDGLVRQIRRLRGRADAVDGGPGGRPDGPGASPRTRRRDGRRYHRQGGAWRSGRRSGSSSRPYSFGGALAAGLARHRPGLDPDRPDGPGAALRADLQPGGRRADPDRADGGPERPAGAGPVPSPSWGWCR